MKTFGLVVVALLLSGGVCAVSARAGERKPGASKAQPVKIISSWSGKLGDEALRKLEPVGNFIVDRDAWTKLWKAWRKQEDVPAVDFEKQMLLVFTAGGPNSVGCTPTHDGKGNVRADAQSTLIGGPGFGYLILCIPCEGVKTVNGKPLPGVKVPPGKPRRKTPQGQPGFAPSSPPQDSSSSSPTEGPGVESDSPPGASP